MIMLQRAKVLDDVLQLANRLAVQLVLHDTVNGSLHEHPPL